MAHRTHQQLFRGRLMVGQRTVNAPDHSIAGSIPAPGAISIRAGGRRLKLPYKQSPQIRV